MKYGVEQRRYGIFHAFFLFSPPYLVYLSYPPQQFFIPYSYIWYNTSMSATPAVAIQSLSVTINNTPILFDISTDIATGTIVGLLGPSGSGKTTIIRTILGLQKPSAGSVTVFGLKPGVPALRQQTGYVSQDAAAYSDLTVTENVRYFGDLLGVSQRDVLQAIDRVELSDHKDQIVSSLSGGQRTRVSLALALLGKPTLLLLDEPTVGLDPVLRQNLWKLFRALANEGATILITSHVMDEAERCDSLLFIRDGRLLASGTNQEILTKAQANNMEAAFLALAQKDVRRQLPREKEEAAR